MGIFASLWNAQATPGPTDDFWYSAVGEGNGEVVTPDSVMKIAALYGCVNTISEDMGKFPIYLWEWVGDSVKKEAIGHPVYQMLTRRPNKLQTWGQFAELMTWDALLRSAGFAEIIPGPKGFLAELRRIHPDSIVIEELPQHRVRYKIKERLAGGQIKERYLGQEQVFVLPGKFFDGFSLATAPIKMMMNVLSTAQAKQNFENTLFRNGVRLSGALQTDEVLDDGQFERVRQSWQQTYAGPNNAGKVAILEKGLKFEPISMTSEDAQFIESSKLTARDIAVFFRVPAHKIGIMDNANYSNIENENKAYFTDTVMSWSTRWQQAINSQLLLDPDRYFAKYDFSLLLRGDSAARGTLYTALTNAGAITPDEIREMEDMNPLLNGEGEKPVRPLNMTQGGPGGTNKSNGGFGDDGREEGEDSNEDEEEKTSAQSPSPSINAEIWNGLFMDAAERVTSAEIRGIEKRPKKINDFQDWLKAFYADHRNYIIKSFEPLVSAYQKSTGKGINIEHAADMAIKQGIERISGCDVTFVLEEWKRERAKNILTWLEIATYIPRR